MTESAATRIPTKAIVAVVAVVALILLLLYLQGTIGAHKVAPGTVPLPSGSDAGLKTVKVEQREVEDTIDWPGTVTSRSVANVAPKVMAHVVEVRVNVGSTVKGGDVIATLDAREIKARAQQARAALAAAQAQAAQADSEQRRTQALFKKQAATQQDLDAVNARAQAARAQVAQARDAITEVEVMVGDTSIKAPFDGVVARRLVDPGDMAVPGKPLVVIQDPRSLRFETQIAERCIGALAVGAQVPVRFDTPKQDVTGRVEEIAPIADPRSRTFLVKVGLPAGAGLQPGGFGTLRSPCGKHQAVLVPRSAIVRMGQLEAVRILADGAPRIRNVRTGKTYGDEAEVLSGLHAGEVVVIGQ